MRITADGQVTIPAEIRERLGLTPDTEVAFDVHGNGVLIRPAAPDASEGEQLTRGQRAVAALREAGRRHWGGMTTEELMELTRGPFDDVHRGQ